MADYSNSKYLKEWTKEMTKVMLRVHPEWDKDEVKELLMKKAQKEIVNPPVELDNNYTHENKVSSLLSVFDWALDRKPIIAGNGTFYKNQNEAINPTAVMLASLLGERKSIKKSMFDCPPGSEMYKYKDRQQNNKKRSCNSWYGASGMPSSPFYSQWSGPATTCTAQSVISTTETMFEAFLSDNFYFIDINECMTWLELVRSEKNVPDDFVIRKNANEVFERLRSRFVKYDESYDKILMKYLSNCNSDELTMIFYKNQLHHFTEVHKEVIDLYEKIFSNIKNGELLDEKDKSVEVPDKYKDKFKDVKSYNAHVSKELFMDPNSLPDTIKKYMDKIKDIYMKYIYVPYIQFDKIYRLKYYERKAVVIVDTDSNILNCTPWVDFCFDNIMKSDYGRDTEQNVFIAVNSITYVLTSAVNDILLEYGKKSNVPKEHRHLYNMKNEFFFVKLIIAKKKKRYLSLIALREGNLYNPKRVDVKGFDFMKSGTAELASEFYMSVVKKRLLYSKGVDIIGLRKDIKEFENTIYKSLKNGSTEYLPIINCKPAEAYPDKPFSKQQVRAAYAWNVIHKDNTVDLPMKMKVLKLKIFKLDDIEEMRETNPKVYSIIKNEIFGSKNKVIAKAGLQVLAVPQGKPIPKWALPYIDYNTIINNIIGQFNAVLEIFDISEVAVGKSVNGVNRKTNKISNIINL